MRLLPANDNATCGRNLVPKIHSNVKNESNAFNSIPLLADTGLVASGGMSPSVMKLLIFHKSNKIHINPI